MHILWASDSPLQPSAYAQQTELVTPLIAQLGHKITIYSGHHYGKPITYNGIKIIGTIDAPGYNQAALFDLHAQRIGADILLTFKDPYVFPVDIMRKLKVPWVAVVPVDTEPLCDANAEVLQFASAVIAVSKVGMALLDTAHLAPLYVPHGFNTKVFDIQSREEARTKCGIPNECFIALFVGDNCVYPTRKNIENIVAAWSMFLAKHSDGVLMLHTMLAADRGGVDIQELLRAYNVPGHNIFISDQYQYAFGFPQSYMATLYNAADVLLMPSTGEGFGMPVVEAQLCGTPVITTDWTAMRETTHFGVRIKTSADVRTPCPTGALEVVPIGGFRFRAHAAAILEALELAYLNKPKDEDRITCRKSVLAYDINNVMESYWKPTIVELEQLLVKGHANGILRGLPKRSGKDSSLQGSHRGARGKRPDKRNDKTGVPGSRVSG